MSIISHALKRLSSAFRLFPEDLLLLHQGHHKVERRSTCRK